MGGYQARLELMEDWYRQLVQMDEREQILLQDYAPHEQYLQSLSGSVIDIGGGAGIAARFLQPDVTYVVADPSEVWDSPDWMDFSRKFRGSGPEPQFVKANGEELPFPDAHFDAALAFWSLNHASDPVACVAEIARVLKPGGVARLVVDDVEPRWTEIIADGARRIPARFLGQRNVARIRAPLKTVLGMKLRGNWEIHDDHIPIRQRDLNSWVTERMQVRRSQWLDGSLTYDLVKL